MSVFLTTFFKINSKACRRSEEVQTNIFQRTRRRPQYNTICKVSCKERFGWLLQKKVCQLQPSMNQTSQGKVHICNLDNPKCGKDAVFLGKLLLIFSSIVTDMLPIETACLPPLLSLLVMKDGQTHLGGLVCIGF